ncbi:MAG: hypothetical protein WAV31_01300 [Candidatus Moraniibacteriota bacterium]
MEKKISVELAKIYADFLDHLFFSRELMDLCGTPGNSALFFRVNQKLEKLKERARAATKNNPPENGIEILSQEWWREKGFPSFENIVP